MADVVMVLNAVWKLIGQTITIFGVPLIYYLCGGLMLTMVIAFVRGKK